MISSLRRQSQTLSSIRRGGTQARVPTSTRMARLRGRFPGQPRTLSSSSRGVNSLFPPNMDLDMVLAFVSLVPYLFVLLCYFYILRLLVIWISNFRDT